MGREHFEVGLLPCGLVWAGNSLTLGVSEWPLVPRTQDLHGLAVPQILGSQAASRYPYGGLGQVSSGAAPSQPAPQVRRRWEVDT